MKKLSHVHLLFALGLAVLSTAEAALVAHYKFDSSDFLGDSSSNNVDLTNGTTAATNATGAGDFKFGDGSMRVDSGAYTFANNTAAAGVVSGSYTLSLWFRVDAVNVGGTNSILSTREAQGYLIYVDGGDGLRFARYIGGTPSTAPIGHTVVANTWTHVAVAHDSGTGESTYYVNGVATGNKTSYATNTATNGNFAIAARQSSGNNTLPDGNIDDLGIWDEALNASQINTIYTSGVDAVPEPTSLSLLGIAAFASLVKRRR